MGTIPGHRRHELVGYPIYHIAKRTPRRRFQAFQPGPYHVWLPATDQLRLTNGGGACRLLGLMYTPRGLPPLSR